MSPHAYNISDELKRIRSKISLGKLRFQNLWCLQFSSLPIIFELLIPYMIILHSGNLSRHHWTSLSESDIEMSQFLETLKETSLISSDFFPTFSGEKLSSSADNASLNLSQAAPLRSEMDEFLVFFDDEISEDPIEEFSDSD